MPERIIFLVEGDTDDAFFNELFRKLEIKESFEIKSVGGKPNFGKHISTLIAIERRKLFVATDIDKREPKDVINSIKNSIKRTTRANIKIEGNKIVCKKSKIYVIPLGLKNYSMLKKFGIEKHSLEDYVLKILFEDDDIIKKLSKSKIKNKNDLINCLKIAKSSLEKNCRKIDSSKSLLDLVMVIMDFRASPATFIRECVKNCKIDLIKEIFKSLKIKG